MSGTSHTNGNGHPPEPESRGCSGLMKIGIGLLVVIPLIGLLLPSLIVSKKDGKRAEAVSNAKQIGKALLNYRDKYGSFPDASTLSRVRQEAKDPSIRLGLNTSNDFFRQLFAAGVMNSERPFYARVRSCHKPDDRMKGSMLLEKGEVAFAYVVSHSTCAENDVPILIAPLVKGKLLSDPKAFDGTAVVFHTDTSVDIVTVRKDGSVAGPNHKDFFDPSQPYWHGIPPKVAWPE